MDSKNKSIADKACLGSNSQGDAHDPLNDANIFAENGDKGHTEFKHTYNQKRILDAMEKKIQSGEQMLFFDHSAEGAGKSTAMKN